MPQPCKPRPLDREASGAGQACLERTRTAVFNVLIAVGFLIAVSGGLLRLRTRDDGGPASGDLHRELLTGLMIIGVVSYATRRILSQKLVGSKSAADESLFYWSHVLPAIIAALAAPLGLVYGWCVDSSVQSIIPFWVVALALGSLALPRVSELECFDRPGTGSESGSP